MPVTQVLHLEAMGFLYALAVVVVYKIVTRQINMEGLITHKDGSGRVSPERIQLLLATIAASATYLTDALSSTNGSLPDVSPQWLYLIGGSSSIYVAGKAWAFHNIKKRI